LYLTTERKLRWKRPEPRFISRYNRTPPERRPLSGSSLPLFRVTALNPPYKDLYSYHLVLLTRTVVGTYPQSDSQITLAVSRSGCHMRQSFSLPHFSDVQNLFERILISQNQLIASTCKKCRLVIVGSIGSRLPEREREHTNSCTRATPFSVAS
jgi:hypothetical protein